MFWQQPFGQLAALQTHAPPRHCWFAGQAAPVVPHSQVPVEVQALLENALQAMQTWPPLPQWLASSAVMQRPPEQQPVEHEVPSQMQAPALHRWPVPHAAPTPQPQTPLTQLSLCESQGAHIAPLAPHALALRVVQVVPEQQPDGHDVASQTQLPIEQRWPAEHAAWVPHMHWPAVQRSAPVAEQVLQLTPPAPQLETVSVVVQMPLVQQPLEQLVELQPLQAWLAHVWPLAAQF